MLIIKSITAKNFLSIGNVTQSVKLDRKQLTLVLGENLDLGDSESGNRNGAGKSVIVNALSYALYGAAVSNIKRDNLINNINNKGMFVTVDFESQGVNYRIERGRKPAVLKFYVNNTAFTAADEDEAQGDSRETQHEIDSVIGLPHLMFKHLVALNTYTVPFLSMRTGDQREIIELLLGATALSEKAETLKSKIKNTKDMIQREQYLIDGITAANNNVQNSIKSLTLKSNIWGKHREDEIVNLTAAIEQLNSIDIQHELEQHRILAEWKASNAKRRTLEEKKAMINASITQQIRLQDRSRRELANIQQHKCPACEQELHAEKHQAMQARVESELQQSVSDTAKLQAELDIVSNEIQALPTYSSAPTTFYGSERDAFDHVNNVNNLIAALEDKRKQNNPYLDQIEELSNNAMQTISWDNMNALVSTKDHQDFLLKLLTNKDSVIRKKIVEQNLTFLNKRISYYISRLGLPHKVSFRSDLCVEITQLGKDLDFENLSRGEMNRLILSISFSFRDVWEGIYNSINLMFVDELLDNGTDRAGLDNLVGVLKGMCHSNAERSIWVISHREELIPHMSGMFRAIKENGFTSYEEVAND